MCSTYMRYGEEIDEYLQNRPHPLIRHCLLKKKSWRKFGFNWDSCNRYRKFSVIYYKYGQKRHYNVDFGRDETMPSCCCPDWKMSAYPCKYLKNMLHGTGICYQNCIKFTILNPWWKCYKFDRILSTTC